jgi:hypothetical protein
VREVAGMVGTIALASGTLAACADRGPTAPARVPSLAGTLSGPAYQRGKPTREDVPDFVNEFVLPAGVACSFSVAGEPVVNRVVLKTFPADRNGDVVEMTTGALVERFTNLATGKSITVNISGPGKVTRHPDGSSTQEAVGQWAWFLIDPSSVPGGFTFFLSTGRLVVETSPTGEQTIVSQVGRLEDLCAALS